VKPSVAATDQPDGALIRQFMRGDEQAFRVLYRRHTPRLRMLVLRLVGYHEADADDVVQETWLAGCRAIRGFRGDAKFSTWLTTIAIRTARQRLALDLRTDATYDESELGAAEPNIGDSIDVERALSLLPSHSRAVLVLHDIEGFTHEEIARQLGVAIGTSKATLSRARAKLRRYLTVEVTHG
jgi:RNA polymerase sigma factor (sigma-70 family)